MTYTAASAPNRPRHRSSQVTFEPLNLVSQVSLLFPGTAARRRVRLSRFSKINLNIILDYVSVPNGLPLKFSH
jgi:hypothetical protein